MEVWKMLNLQKKPVIGIIGTFVLRIWGCDIPKTVKIPHKLYLAHHGNGVCVHPSTEIEKGVRIFQQVTIGRADVYLPGEQTTYEKIVIKEYAILGAGCKILNSKGTMTIGENAIIAANSVVLCDVPANEVWGGIPARKLYTRDEKDIFHGPAE